MCYVTKENLLLLGIGCYHNDLNNKSNVFLPKEKSTCIRSDLSDNAIMFQIDSLTIVRVSTNLEDLRKRLFFEKFIETWKSNGIFLKYLKSQEKSQGVFLP